MRINALLPIAGVVGGIYSAGFLFGYNYHKRYTEEEESRLARDSIPLPAPDLKPEAEKPSQTFATNPLIYKFGLPVAGPTLHYANHVLQYDQIKKIPRWVAETLTEVGFGWGCNGFLRGILQFSPILDIVNNHMDHNKNHDG